MKYVVRTCHDDIKNSKNVQVEITPNEEEKAAERLFSPYFHNNKNQLMLSDRETELIVSATYIKLKSFIRNVEGANWEAEVEFEDLDKKLEL